MTDDAETVATMVEDYAAKNAGGGEDAEGKPEAPPLRFPRSIDQWAEKDAEIARLSRRLATVSDAAGNLVIAVGMGWDLAGVVEAMTDALQGAKAPQA